MVMDEREMFVSPTGKAADNLLFKCSTIHSAFGISIKKLDKDNDNPRKFSLVRNNLEKVTLLVIKDFSMVSAALLSEINYIIQKALGNEQSFGGISVLLVGDICQLLPVNSTPMWAQIVESSVDLDTK